MLYDLDTAKVAVSVSVVPAVALAESVIVPVPIDAIVVPVGMPVVPAIACPTARPSVEETDVTDALPFAMVPVTAIGVVPLMVTTTFWFPVGIGV
jgi:hypothetical protein